MTAAEACTPYGRHSYRSRLLAVVVTVAIAAAAVAATPTGPAYAATDTVGPVPMTFEGGETATALPDDTLYAFEEDMAIALNATAAAAGDYVYEDHDDSTSTDVLQTPRGRYSSEPDKYVLVVKADSAAVPVTTISTIAAVPVTTISTIAAVPAMNSTAEPTSTAVPTTTTTTATAPIVTTKSGILVQIAGPLGYGGAPSTTITVPTTTPMPPTLSSAVSSDRSTAIRVVLTAAACTLLLLA